MTQIEKYQEQNISENYEKDSQVRLLWQECDILSRAFEAIWNFLPTIVQEQAEGNWEVNVEP